MEEKNSCTDSIKHNFSDAESLSVIEIEWKSIKN